MGLGDIVMAHTLTPLRFPGGKTKLYSLVKAVIHENSLAGCTYVEPFSGGAGLAIKLLLLGDVSQIHINDIDPAIYSIWHCVLNNSEDLIDFVNNVPLTIEEWKYQQSIYSLRDCEDAPDLITLGKASLYMNRTNRSGIMSGGVIGGMNQDGLYRIDARFNRTTLVNKITAIYEKRKCISLTNQDAKALIKTTLPLIKDSFTYFDPPYVNKGPSLYQNAFSESDHRELSEAIKSYKGRWIVTYDRCELIEQLYEDYISEITTISYSAGSTKTGEEIIIYGNCSPVSKALQQTA